MSSDWESPLANFFEMTNVGQLGPLDRRNEQTEAEIQQCMAEQGFEYLPFDLSEPELFGQQYIDGLRRGTIEWTAVYGFGVSTLQFTVEDAPGLVGRIRQEFPIDPNAAHVEGLSFDDQTAWMDQQAICDAAAVAAERERSSPYSLVLRELGNDYATSVFGRAESDSRYLELLDQRRACLSDLGFTYDANIGEVFETRLDPVWRLDRGSPEFVTALAEVQQEEVTTAVVYGECELLDFQLLEASAVFVEALIDAEEAFISENEGSLLALRERFESQASPNE